MEEQYMQQMSIFDDVIERYKINKPIRLIEFFAGIGSQAKALEVLGANFEHYKICEWAYNSYCAYNSIHIKDKTDYSKDLSKEELVKLVNGTSINYNEPLTESQLNKKPIEWLRNAYNNIKATHNLVNIMNVKGKDLEIVDTDKYVYLVSYSFPCQDLSLAGKRAGMSVSQAVGGTRSGLLWEIERILAQLRNDSQNSLPQILVMENVPEVCGTKNVRDFEKWQMRLNQLGYTNYCEILNAKDYGIPQNRRRCFMVSILGDYNYTFPKKIHLKHRLKDLLEKDVDEKYFLSQKMVEYISSTGTKDFSVNNSEINCKIARPLTTEQNKRAGTTNYIADGLPDNTDLRSCKKIVDLNYYKHEQSNRVYDADSLSPTITTGHDDAKCIKIGYIEKGTGKHQSNTVYNGENISPTLSASDAKEPVKILTIGNYGNGHHSQDVTDPKGLMPTLTTGNHNNGQVIAVKKKESEKDEDGFVAKHYDNYAKDHNGEIPEMFNPYNEQEIKDLAPAQTTQCGSTTSSASVLIKNATKKGYEEAKVGDGVDISTRMHHHRGTVQKGSCQTITTMGGENVGVVVPNLKQELCDKLVEEGKVQEGDIVNHSYSTSRLKGRKTVERQNEMPALTTRPDTMGVAVKDTAFTEIEKELITEDGNIKRYIGSDKVDKFKDGQMATTTFPNGYGHGPRTHNESIALNTIDRPIVKNDLRIRKLVPVETMKLMGFTRKDTQAMRDIGLSDAAIYHCAGDSIVSTVLVGIFSNLINDLNSHEQIINDYVEKEIL